MNDKLQKISVKIPQEEYQALLLIAKNNGKTLSQIIRQMISTNLAPQIAKENIDLVRQNLSDELRNYCDPQFDRLAKLEAKIGYQSVSSFYLLTYLIENILPYDKKINSLDLQKKAKLMAISYLQFKEYEVDRILKAEDTAINKMKN